MRFPSSFAVDLLTVEELHKAITRSRATMTIQKSLLMVLFRTPHCFRLHPLNRPPHPGQAKQRFFHSPGSDVPGVRLWHGHCCCLTGAAEMEPHELKEPVMLPIRTILHPTDFSDRSAEAFRLACSLARDCDGLLIVLHVLERPLIVYGGVAMAPPAPAPSPEERQSIQEQLHQIQPPDPGIRIEHLYEEGDPATAILQIARERECDLIVMGTHGRTGLSHLLMGSVAEKVLRKAPCPVLTVKTPQGARVHAAEPAPAGAM